MKVLARSGNSVPLSPRLSALFRFLVVGFTGIAVNEIAYVALTDSFKVWFVAAAFISTLASTSWNFAGNELWSFRGRKFVGHRWVRFAAYGGVNVALLGFRVPMLWFLSHYVGTSSAVSNLITLGALFALRFAFSDGFVWRKKQADPFEADATDGSAVNAPAFRYDISGLIRLDSDAELPELAYFRTKATTPADIVIKIRRVGFGPKVSVRLRRDGDRISYREHLGVLGADFNVTLGDPILIEASQLLGLSRHVLYTNIVEALLRFVLVSKGYVLLHSAGMEVDGQATLLSAQTDTGKTSTVINLIRQRGWGFISDDMAIIDPAGRVRTFPKPMTLSYHTMVRAVDADTLGTKKKMQLQVQSRVHSKSGRGVGKGLGSLNVPIMSMNSVVQVIVPPPKYHITSLLPARITPEAPIAHVFLMERGEPVQERVALEAAVDQLIENTDDAYGFPPFSTLAPNLVIDGQDYLQLRARERELLTQALANVEVWRLRVRGHEWNELLPRLMGVEDVAPATSERESVGIPIHTDDREPVGIPVEAEERHPFGVPVAAETSSTTAALLGDYLSSSLHGSGHGDATAEPAGSMSFSTGKLPESYEGMPPFRSSAAGDGTPGAQREGRSAAPAPLSVKQAALADALVIPRSGGYGLAGGLPLAPDFAAIRARAQARVRAGARTWIALSSIILVGALVRLWGIGVVGFNNDEAVYVGQGAALAGDQTYAGLFAIFRAHPLLVQFLNSIPFRFVGVNDVTPRLISVAFGLGGIALAYSSGSLLFNRRVGLITAALLALMPYHVVVTRQALLDGPETTLFLLGIYSLARYARSGQYRWIYGAALASALTVLAKETAVLIVPVAIAFLMLTPEIRIPFRHQMGAIATFILAVSPYPVAILIAKGANGAGSFVLWQVLRQPNHTWTFYAEIMPAAVGPLVLILSIAGLLYAIHRGLWEDRLLLCWVAVPIAFFELWPVKGFQYLLPIAPAIAILAALSLDKALTAMGRANAQGTWFARVAAESRGRVRLAGRVTGAAHAVWIRTAARTPENVVRSPRLPIFASAIVIAIAIGSIAAPTAAAVNSTSMSGSLAGTGGLPGGRETGTWIRNNVPEGAVFLTLGPTMGNIVEFYGQRKAYGLSVSPNPIRRNPAYDPLVNPDRALQLNKVQYIATDIWSAQRSPFFESVLKHYITRYHGRLVYQQMAQTSDAAGNLKNQIVIQIYEVRP